MYKKTVRYNFRLKPTTEQEAKLIEFGAYSRGIWNLLLSENIRRYQYDKTFIFYNGMAKLLTELKKFEEFKWIKDFDSAAAQQVARDLDDAIRNATSKSRLQKFPAFKVSYKSKKQHNDSFRCVNNSNCIRVENGFVSIPKVGKVPIVLHRGLVSSIKTVTVGLRHGKWEASFTQEIYCKPKKKSLNAAIGYDINSHYSVVGSNGWYVPNPKLLKESATTLKELQVQLSRRKKGSGRWIKTKDRINKLHGLISRKRKSYAHEVSNSIAKSSDIVVFEDLNVKAMQQFNGTMVADNIMGMITGLVKYKVELNGGIYHEIGRFVKSSGICSECGENHKLDLKDRVFTCINCGTSQCRDWSAAMSIRDTGERDLMEAGTVTRVLPITQKKSADKTKVFEFTLKFAVGHEKKEAA